MNYNFIQKVRVQSVRLGSVDKFLYSIFSNTLNCMFLKKSQKTHNFLTRIVLNRRITCPEDAAGDGASPAVSMLH